jgi:phosphoribosylformimino-5-aminoimidazole carboxamide ribotide isomerase
MCEALQGRMDQESVYSEDPAQMAKRWESKEQRDFMWLISTAVTGTPVHHSLIKEIANSVRIPVEVGGGFGI